MITKEQLVFDKRIYNITNKTREQLKGVLDLEVETLENLNPGYALKNIVKGDKMHGSLSFKITFERV